ncbi:fumarylacetoacetate hydrolase-like protein [Rhizodiscina lignyota]|uniref:Fumarylacetoacetate hydrolase-like protein n=1 Tax=Rhizodiscina lignyota TaxID=1504668 RepID=A0A9P4I8M2_9PEZI|nr:fumarylacetoacetate hydrolase-like protein [Rhizodiscina lignyota]
MGSHTEQLSNYVAFVDPEGDERIGHLNLDEKTIQPLSFVSGTPIKNLYQVIEAGPSNIAAAGDPIQSSSVKVLPPISGRDVLAVGKNYMEHAKEFNSSGYDSSDKVDQPTHPVLFTKRSSSIIADGDDISPHHNQYTETIDYEGEVGVIIGKPGYRISEQDAWDHVWGYTIINDVTARERQRDHKQFYIGKSGDTFCPMGPIAVPKERLPKQLRVQTFVNGEKRQDATTDDLIFSVPVLIKTLSEGATVQLGDVIATGTPAGVGFGQKPPTFLQPGDEVQISVTGLGTLRNKIGSSSKVNGTTATLLKSAIHLTNGAKSINGHVGLTNINSKPLHYKHLGSGGPSIVFVHGLGGTMDYYTPLISSLSLTDSHSLHLSDLEGHGLSPTHPLSVLSIESFAADIGGVFQHAGVSDSNPATLVAHSMGCLAAMTFALNNPALVKKLILIGPPPSPLPEAAQQGTHARAMTARTKGMGGVVDAVVTAATSDQTKSTNQLAVAAARLSLLGQDPEGYAKACTALAGATKTLSVEDLKAETLLITGDADKVSPPALVEKYSSRIPNARHAILDGCGHWHNFENLSGVVEAVKGFL